MQAVIAFLERFSERTLQSPKVKKLYRARFLPLILAVSGVIQAACRVSHQYGTSAVLRRA